MGPERKGTMQNSKVFSMSSVRDVTARLVSGFFYAAPHSPECARNKNVVSTKLFGHDRYFPGNVPSVLRLVSVAV